MSPQPQSYRQRLKELRIAEEQRSDLIEELITKLEDTDAKLEQAELDLQAEQDARRRLQQDMLALRNRGRIVERRPFAVVLIDADADGYAFQDRFIKAASTGGEEAADELLTATQEYLRTIVDDSDRLDVVVKAFAHLDGLGSRLVREARVKDTAQVRAFCAGFSSRLPMFDFVDVGFGKERADNKIREYLKFFAESPQCKHIMLACCHDSGYAPFLGQFVADKSALERITLLVGSPAAPSIRKLGFKHVTQFRSVFTFTGSQEGTYSSVQGGQVFSYAVPPRQFARLGPISANNGRRADPPLSVEQQLVERMKRLNLCSWLFLRGECRGCPRNHRHPPLSDVEFDALWYIARQGRCFKDRRDGCSDAKCIYGHGSTRND
ncbi:hypothetical protein NW755_014737 [Fusarium falciforme]|uniref:DUF7923 domain-containing protein n=2 Tax=Fusarium solani species complex TaxID=232080 RepID=A0A9W8UU13_9HYPO|nr:hypothetical protein NW755_014737 [Fusarium falciforme]